VLKARKRRLVKVLLIVLMIVVIITALYLLYIPGDQPTTEMDDSELRQIPWALSMIPYVLIIFIIPVTIAVVIGASSRKKDRNHVASNSGYEISNLRFLIVDADYEPEDLRDQLPLAITLIRKISEPDHPDYWLAFADKEISWNGKAIRYLVLSARFIGVSITKGIGQVAINLAYVTDESILYDKFLNFQKCTYVAICIANEIV